MRAILGVLRRIPRPSPAMAVAMLTLLIAASGVGMAATPSDGTITGCYDKRGNLRVIDPAAGETCQTAFETQLSWKDGSTLLGKMEKATDSDRLDGKDSTDFYAAGSKVADSAKLDGKSADAIGVNGLERVFETSGFDSASPKLAMASCPAGKIVVGTGYDIDRGKSGFRPNQEANVVVDEVRVGGGGSDFVDVVAYEEDATPVVWRVTAIAICAKAP